MSGATLPGAPESEQRIVLHVDMDCFYASCERLREPDLEGEPLVIGMGYEDGGTHGAVATASYEARDHGVESAQAISQAVERLPPKRQPDVGPTDAERGHYRPVDMAFYKSVSADVKEILHDCADVVREVSVDEAYLDVTERTAWEPARGADGRPKASDAAGATDGVRTLAEGYARHVKQRIIREVGVPASVGVAPNMSTAKIASDYDKPDGLVVVRPERVRSFLDPLPVAELHGVGPVTARELHAMGIETAGDVAAADPARLRDRFGERGRELYDRARGDDDREVTPRGLPKSLSRESAFAEATDDAERARERVRALAADVAERARSRGALYGTIGIKVVTPPYDVHTRAHSLPGPIEDDDLVETVALDLLTEFEGERVRKLGVRVSSLEFSEADQARLDGWEGTVADGDGEEDVADGDGEEDVADGDGEEDGATAGVGQDASAGAGQDTAAGAGEDTGTGAGEDPTEAEASDDPAGGSDGQVSLGDF